MHRAIGVAARRAIGAGEILHRIGEIGVGVEQAVGVARVADTARGAEPDLHQSVIAGVHGAGIAAALDLDDAANEMLGHAVGGGVLGDQCIVGAGLCGGRKRQRRECGQSHRQQGNGGPALRRTLSPTHGHFDNGIIPPAQGNAPHSAVARSPARARTMHLRPLPSNWLYGRLPQWQELSRNLGTN